MYYRGYDDIQNRSNNLFKSGYENKHWNVSSSDIDCVYSLTHFEHGIV